MTACTEENVKPCQSTICQTVSAYLPVRIVLVVTARHGTDVRLLGGQIGGDPLLEVVASQMVLEVAVRVLGRGLELTDGTNLNSVLSGVPGNT